MHGLDYLFLSDSLVPLNQAHPGRSKDGAHSSSQVKEIEMNASNSWQNHVKPVVRDARATKDDKSGWCSPRVSVFGHHFHCFKGPGFHPPPQPRRLASKQGTFVGGECLELIAFAKHRCTSRSQVHLQYSCLSSPVCLVRGSIMNG